jgi:branched-subunit amino acid ABC-type transport system permease component
VSQFVSTVILGAFVGSTLALLGLGLVLTYRTSGVLNLAQGALGMLFAFVYFQLTQGGRMHLVVMEYDQHWKLPRLLALAVVLLVMAPLLGAGLDAALFRRLRTAGATVQIVATIGLLIAFQGVAGVVWTNASTLAPRSIFPRRPVHFLGSSIASDELYTLLTVIVLAVALLAFLRYSPLGVRMRAVVDRKEVAQLMGVDAERVSAIAWAIGASFAALGGILIAPFYGSMQILDLTLLVIPAIGAAVIGRLESLPLALAGALGIGIAEQMLPRYVHGLLGNQLAVAVPFAVLFVALLLPIRWPAADTASPPPPPRHRTHREGWARLVPPAIVLAVLLLPPFVIGSPMHKVFGGSWRFSLAAVPAAALILLSLVVLTGYAGQISLCQAAFAGFGAFTATHLVVDHGWSLFLAAPVAALLTVPLGAVLALRATRLPPLFLGLATLAFASLMQQVTFTARSFSNGIQPIHLRIPTIVHGPLAYYIFGLGVFFAAAGLMTNLRQGRTGYALVAMRDSPDGLASLGESLARSKFVIFCLSAFLAGLGGALYAGARGNAQSADYVTLASMLFLALAVIGGVSRWPGAFVGAFLFVMFQPLLEQPFIAQNFILKHFSLAKLREVFFGFAAIGLAQNPHGIVEQTREGWNEFMARFAKPVVEPAGDAAAAPAPDGGVAPAPAPSLDGTIVAPAKARLYHRPACLLVTGKEAKPVTAAAARKLAPCPACEPPDAPVTSGRSRARPGPSKG